MLRAVIVDDEVKATKSLSWEISNFSDRIEVIKTFTVPEEGLNYINNNEIDCLFLDIEMPTMDGFHFLNRIRFKDFAIIITTAYDEYGIKALKEGVIDYLLKPIDSDDLENTITKIEKHHQLNKKHKKDEFFEKILINFNNKIHQKKITINTDGKLVFLNQCEIIFVESDGNYSSVHLTVGKKIIVTKKLKEINELLPPDYFLRVHNSFVINLNKVKEFYKADGYVVLEGNHRVPISRQKKSEFLDKI